MTVYSYSVHLSCQQLIKRGQTSTHRPKSRHTAMTEICICHIQVAASAMWLGHMKELETFVVHFGRRYRVHVAK